MKFYKYFAPLALLLSIVGSQLSFPVRAQEFVVGAQQQGDPSVPLSRGRTLLKQGHADQALGYLQTALGLYTQANNPRGIAASEDALGDLYLVQGQYKVALDHYQKAYDAFVVAAGKDQKTETAANSVASRAGSTAA